MFNSLTDDKSLSSCKKAMQLYQIEMRCKIRAQIKVVRLMMKHGEDVSIKMRQITYNFYTRLDPYR